MTKMMMIAAMVLAFALRAHSCTLCGLPCPESCFTALAADSCPTVNAGNGNNNDDVPLACGSMISALQDAGDSNLKNVFASVVNTACADTGGAGKLERALAAQSNGSRKKCTGGTASSDNAEQATEALQTTEKTEKTETMQKADDLLSLLEESSKARFFTCW